jgi:hypothetical protein
LLRFNGGLFAESTAFDLTADQLKVLLQAAKREWKDVEPAIFGTLLERALDPKERSKLGAHYTPRSYVERLVRPVVMEPLREQWDLVQGEVKQILGDVEIEPTAAQKKKAVAVLESFLTELRRVRILDPACGSGNFLYVTLDLIKQLESEVLRRLEDVTGQAQLRLDIAQVNPSQFLGIELNPRAAAIADLVIWIGYLQWHFRRFGDIPPVEPVLREYKNIECRDAVLAYDGKEPDVDSKTGKVRTRWGGRMMRHPVTGEDVPDPSDQIPIYRYINPRSAEWQEADYIVSNPPFVANSDMRELLGDGYTETLREVYSDIPATVDYVLYWWHKSAKEIREKKSLRFGLITTNTIRQERQRIIIDFHQRHEEPIRLFFAIPDHPWAEGDAAVTVTMTGADLEPKIQLSKAPVLGILTRKENSQEFEILYKNEKFITSSLRASLSATDATQLQSNLNLAAKGFEPGCLGFIVEKNKFQPSDQALIRPFKKLSHLVKGKNLEFVIDVNFVENENDLMALSPYIYQHLVDHVKSVRVINNDQRLREKWWHYRRSNEALKKALSGLSRYIITGRTAKHRCFFFCEIEAHCETEVICIGLNDAFILGILSSSIHSLWALSPRIDLGGNTPRYFHDVCFNTFPFPNTTPDRQQKIRELGDRLDSHRKRVQSQHPDVTITAMYNLLEKLRAGEPLTDKDREFNNKALVSTLKQIHDELDAAVFEAYGWEDLLDPPQPPLKRQG